DFSSNWKCGGATTYFNDFGVAVIVSPAFNFGSTNTRYCFTAGASVSPGFTTSAGMVVPLDSSAALTPAASLSFGTGNRTTTFDWSVFPPATEIPNDAASDSDVSASSARAETRCFMVGVGLWCGIDQQRFQEAYSRLTEHELLRVAGERAAGRPPQHD